MRHRITNVIKKNFGDRIESQWKPRMPKHKIVLDSTGYRAPHAVWNMKDAEKVQITHENPTTFRDKIAYFMMKTLRKVFDAVSGYRPGRMTEDLYMRRCIFLETVAGVPGMVGGMMRHLNALRSLKEDGGWIHHLLEEAENERMHLLTFLKIRKPSLMFKFFVMWSQLLFITYYLTMYLISSKMAHRFVAYLEEEAVKTYTVLIKDLDEGKLPAWSDKPAPQEAINYWGLSQTAKLRDVFVSIRADEVMHREFNHHFADVPVDCPIEGHRYVIKDSKNASEGSKVCEDMTSSKQEAKIDRELC